MINEDADGNGRKRIIEAMQQKGGDYNVEDDCNGENYDGDACDEGNYDDDDEENEGRKRKMWAMQQKGVAATLSEF